MRRLALVREARSRLDRRPRARSAPGRRRRTCSAYVQVVEKEWSLVLSRQRIRSGQAIVEAVNFGMDAHNLALRRAVPGAKVVRLPTIDHGEHVDRTLRLAAGRYTLWCTLPGHRGRGMAATLVVTLCEAAVLARSGD